MFSSVNSKKYNKKPVEKVIIYYQLYINRNYDVNIGKNIVKNAFINFML